MRKDRHQVGGGSCTFSLCFFIIYYYFFVGNRPFVWSRPRFPRNFLAAAYVCVSHRKHTHTHIYTDTQNRKARDRYTDDDVSLVRSIIRGRP